MTNSTPPIDQLTIAELFDFGYDLQNQLESNTIEQKLETFNSAIERLRLTEEKIDELHLFSDNEEINEIASNELRYFILYALLGWLYEFRPSIVRERRLEDAHLAISYFIKYLQLCKNYGLIEHVPKEDDRQTSGHGSVDRQTKIQKLKEKKVLEQSIGKLREMARDANRVDDEIKRQLYTSQIRWWIGQAEEEINALKDESRLIQDHSPSNNSASSSSTNNKLPIAGPFVLTTTKDRLYKEAIGGKGYSNLPTMTVEEFYDQMAANQSQQQQSVPPPPPPKSTPEQLDEIDDPLHRQSVRQNDEFKDENPRGSGNRYNRS